MEIVFGFLSVVLAVMTLVFAFTLSKRTDRLVQSEDSRVKELLTKMDERTAKMDEDSKRGREEFQQILAKMDASAERQNEILREVQASGQRQVEILREVQASAERIEETQKYVAELVRIEGEKTRSLISH